MCTIRMPLGAFFIVAVILGGCVTTPQKSNLALQASDFPQEKPITLVKTNGELVNLPANLQGVWFSDGRSGIRHPLFLRITGHMQNTFEGNISFEDAHASCLGFHPFKGEIDSGGLLSIIANVGGECGNVKLTLRSDGSQWTGSYDADYPETGSIVLSAK